jgi:hypothetical protein
MFSLHLILLAAFLIAYRTFSTVALGVNNQQNSATVVVLTWPLLLLYVEEKLCAEMEFLRVEGVHQGRNPLRTFSTEEYSTLPQQTKYVQIYHFKNNSTSVTDAQQHGDFHIH